MKGIIISVEFRQRTIAGLADCHVGKLWTSTDKAAEDEIVAYVKKVFSSDSISGINVTFSVVTGGRETCGVARICRDYSDSRYEFYAWDYAAIIDQHEADKLTAKDIRRYVQACREKLEEEAV